MLKQNASPIERPFCRLQHEQLKVQVTTDLRYEDVPVWAATRKTYQGDDHTKCVSVPQTAVSSSTSALVCVMLIVGI